MFNGSPEEQNSAPNFLTDAKELRSNSITSTLASGVSLSIVSLTFRPVSIFLTAITTCTPRNARTRAVSDPIPLEAPKYTQISCQNHTSTRLEQFLINICLNLVFLLKALLDSNPKALFGIKKTSL